MQSVLPNRLNRGTAPLVLSIPHAGTLIPEAIRPTLNAAGLAQPDADHEVDRLYEWARELGLTTLVAVHSRYVVDLNRPPDDQPLYSGAGTGLVPTETFGGEPIYPAGDEPGPAEVLQRLERYWHPYHQALGEELHRIREAHGYALLLDAHSIASEVPRLFTGQLPDLNLGANDGRSADPQLVKLAERALRESGFSYVVDGRFKGGYITRHYGQPEQSVHALQLEISQACYRDEGSGTWDRRKAATLSTFLRRPDRTTAAVGACQCLNPRSTARGY